MVFMLIELIDPETRLCAIDGTALRSYKYNREAKSIVKALILSILRGINWIVTVTGIITPLVFDLTTANFYDNQFSELIYEAKIYKSFFTLADDTYDSYERFEIATDLKLNILIKMSIISIFNRRI